MIGILPFVLPPEVIQFVAANLTYRVGRVALDELFSNRNQQPLWMQYDLNYTEDSVSCVSCRKWLDDGRMDHWDLISDRMNANAQRIFRDTKQWNSMIQDTFAAANMYCRDAASDERSCQKTLNAVIERIKRPEYLSHLPLYDALAFHRKWCINNISSCLPTELDLDTFFG